VGHRPARSALRRGAHGRLPPARRTSSRSTTRTAWATRRTTPTSSSGATAPNRRGPPGLRADGW
jgi:hypothetical protein